MRAQVMWLFSVLVALSVWVRLKLTGKTTALYCCPTCGVFFATQGFTLDDGESTTTWCVHCLVEWDLSR